jgi:hypothetical protein
LGHFKGLSLFLLAVTPVCLGLRSNQNEHLYFVECCGIGCCANCYREWLQQLNWGDLIFTVSIRMWAFYLRTVRNSCMGRFVFTAGVLPLFYWAFNLVNWRFSHCRRRVIDGGRLAWVNGRF